MKYNLSFVVDTKKIDELYNVLISEKPITNDRALYDILKEKNQIKFNIRAKDSTSLRAILNSITTRLQIFEKCEDFKNE